jgi:hypothetical protein
MYTRIVSTTRSKAIPEQVFTDPEVCRRLRLPEFLDNRDMKVVTCQPIAPAAFTAREYSLSEAESTKGPESDRKDYVNEKS